MGVGTVTMYILPDRISARSEENDNPFSVSPDVSITLLKADISASFVRSNPLDNSSIRSLLISNPITLYFFANSIAKGSPTYPKPIIIILKSLKLNGCITWDLLFQMITSLYDWLNSNLAKITKASP